MSTQFGLEGPPELINALKEANLQGQVDALAGDDTPDPHLKINTTAGRLECHHCKATYALPKEDVDLRLMTWILEGFQRDHAACENDPDLELPPIPARPIHENLAHMLPPGAREWLEYGEVGLSSETLLIILTGYPTRAMHRPGWPHYPHDPDDLRRCVLLLEAVPSLEIKKMSLVSATWTALIARWDELMEVFNSEGGVRGSSFPKTYALMQEIFKAVQP